MNKKKYCICGHPKEQHNIDNFGRYVCDHTKDFPDGTYTFDCGCMEYKEKKRSLNDVMPCEKCGLPKKYCICNEIKRETIKKLIKKLLYKDDFKYCHTCQRHHYTGCHIPKGEQK